MKRTIILLAAASTMAGALSAQVDFSGYWHNPMQEDNLERGGGPLSGEYLGVPLNNAARAHADAWSASLWTVPERQCIPHPADYGNSFSNLQMWSETDPESHQVIAWHTHMSWMAMYTGLAANLAVLQGSRLVLLDRVEGPPFVKAAVEEASKQRNTFRARGSKPTIKGANTGM